MFTQEKNRFYQGPADAPLAEITFVHLPDGSLSVDHTCVDGSLRGQGLAEKLLDAVADLARKENRKLTGTCSYAVKQLKDNPKYADVKA